jgi:capsule polysaccharide export protein KpsE/RkpR
MANAFIEELDKLLQAMAHNEAKERLIFLERELHQSSLKLVQAEEALRCFSEKSSVLQIDAQTRSMLEYIATLRATIDSREVQLLVLRQQATPMNYDLIRIETELKGLREKLRGAEAQEAKNLCGDSMIATGKVPSLGLEYLRLFRDVKFQEGQFQLYNKLVELARMDQVRTAAVIQVVDYALPPERRSNTRGRKALLAGGLIFFTMIFAAFIKEYWDQARIREEESKRMAILSQYLKPWLQPIKNITSFILSISRNKNHRKY